MYTTLITLIDRLDSIALFNADVIQWSCPVPFFGDLSRSLVATLGLNPSNREFVDNLGNELQGTSRRFHTLQSLGLQSWSEVDARHVRMIIESCRTYFVGNPYNGWFKKLDKVITGAQVSYYDPLYAACHLDLIPYATTRKWAELTQQQQALLLSTAGDTIGLLLRDSPIRILILNGKSVVEEFQDLSGVCLTKQEMPAWTLPRQANRNVKGVAYMGVVHTLSEIALGREVLVLGYNHNIQSSFGVTTDVVHAIRHWIAEASKELLS